MYKDNVLSVTNHRLSSEGCVCQSRALRGHRTDLARRKSFDMTYASISGLSTVGGRRVIITVGIYNRRPKRRKELPEDLNFMVALAST